MDAAGERMQAEDIGDREPVLRLNVAVRARSSAQHGRTPDRH
jgi:hypothetical protein